MKKKFLSLALALLMVAGATINSLAFCKEEPTLNSVSYTHLTLPTIA